MSSPLVSCRAAAAPPSRKALLALFALGSSALGGCPLDPPPAPELSAQIRRTSFGIPHVLANDEAGLGYGLGHAFAQDNLCMLAELVTTVRGERSKYFGAQQTYEPNGAGPQLNVASDVFFKYVNDDARVDQAWQTQPPELQALLRGYAAGVNRYLRDTPESQRPMACRDRPWVRTLTERDLVRVARRFTLEASGGSLMGAIFAAQPPGSSATSTTPPPYRRTALGSNAIALGRAATESGAGLLLANPHFPWNNALRFYQAHLTIPGKVDVMGAALTGLPLINLGFNRQVAWTHTVNSAAHFTLFALQLDPADPTRYSVDGQWRAMTRKDITVETAEPPGQVVHSLYLTEHGPIVHLPDLLEWTGATAFALRDANLDNDRALEQWWALDRAESLDAFDAEIERVLGLPWVNAVATDRAGEVSYVNVTPVPNVSAEMLAACIPPGLEPLAGMGLFVLSGSDSACNWRESSGAPRAGIFAAAELPKLRRTDFVQNSNDSAWMTNPAAPLAGFSPIVSVEGAELGARTKLDLHWLTARAPGQAPRFTAQALQAFALSNRSFSAAELLPGLRAACAGAPALAAACRVLARWDGTAELASIGWPLYSRWHALLEESGVSYWRVPFDPVDPLRTPRGFAVEVPEVKAAALAALDEAVRQLAAEGLDYSRPWGELQLATRGARKIGIHGGGGEDLYNVVESDPTGLGWREVSYGSSAMFTVSFASGEPLAHGFLTYSQSSDPESPHFADQTERFSAKQWSVLPFSEQQILADPNLTTLQLSE